VGVCLGRGFATARALECWNGYCGATLLFPVTSRFNNSGLEVVTHRDEDLVSAFGPDEGLGVVVRVGSPLLDATGELGDADMPPELSPPSGRDPTSSRYRSLVPLGTDHLERVVFSTLGRGSKDVPPGGDVELA